MARKRKSLLKKHEAEIALGKRTCGNSGAKILKGEICLVVWDDQFARKPYSQAIGLQMIEDARQTLNDLETTLKKKKI